MIKKIYNIIGKEDIIIELESGRLLSLSNKLALKIQESFYHKLENIGPVNIFHFSKENILRENLVNATNVNQIYDVMSSDGSYYLLFTEGEIKSEIIIAPEQLKILLNYFKEQQSSGVPWDDGNF